MAKPYTPGYQPALTLTQPWADLLMYPRQNPLEIGKAIETRSWKRPYRGWIWIHSGKTPAGMGIEYLRRFCFRDDVQYCLLAAGRGQKMNGQLLATYEHLPKGVILGRARLVAIQQFPHHNQAVNLHNEPISANELAFGNYEAGRFGWMFDRAEILREPIPAQGSRMLWPWRLPEKIEDQLSLAWKIDDVVYHDPAPEPSRQQSLFIR